MNTTKQLGSAKLLFEPRPPPSRSHTSQETPTTRRRVQSAKERKGTPSRLGHRSGARPQSATSVSERKKDTRGLLRPPSAKDGRPLPTQFLSFESEVKKNSDSGIILWPPFAKNGQIPPKQYLPLETKVQKSTCSENNSSKKHSLERKCRNNDSRCKSSVGANKEKKGSLSLEGSGAELTSHYVPSGIAALSPWLTNEVPKELIGVDPSSCLVFLPSLSALNFADLPIVPPPQHPEDVLPHKDLPKTPEPFDPKKLFHFNVEKNRPLSAEYVCDHKKKDTSSLIHQIFGPHGNLLYDERKYQTNRTAELIQSEIDDLENLLEGIGSEESSNPMVQYQHDINMLQKSVKDTLAKCNKPPIKMEEIPDPLGLRAYLKEKDRIISRIKARRAECLQELEPEIGFSISVELKNPKTNDDKG